MFIASLQMTKVVPTVVASVIELQSVPSWRVCNRRKQVTCQEEISWQNLQLITNVIVFIFCSVCPRNILARV